MINKREEIFTGLAEVIRADYPDLVFSDTEVQSNPPSFPYVVAVQTNNTVIDRHSTFNNLENAVAESYTISVYDYDEETVIAVMETVNDFFLERGYRRSMYEPVPNLEDKSIVRYIAGFRNTAVV